MSLSIGGFQLSPAHAGPAPSPTAAAPGQAPVIGDQAELSGSAAAAPRFPSWNEKDLGFLKTVSSELSGPQLGQLVKLMNKFGDMLPAFVDLQTSQHRDSVYWDQQNMGHSAFKLAEHLRATGGVGDFARVMAAGIEQDRLDTYKAGPRPLTDQELSDLSKLSGKADLKGPELKLLRVALLKQHGHDLEEYVKTAWPQHRHSVNWQQAASYQAGDLISNLKSHGDLPSVAQKLLENANAAGGKRDLGKA